MRQIQEWVNSKGDEGINIVMNKYFPRGNISFKDFKKFCSNSKLKDLDIQRLFNFFDFERDNSNSINFRYI